MGFPLLVVGVEREREREREESRGIPYADADGRSRRELVRALHFDVAVDHDLFPCTCVRAPPPLHPPPPLSAAGERRARRETNADSGG